MVVIDFRFPDANSIIIGVRKYGYNLGTSMQRIFFFDIGS